MRQSMKSVFGLMPTVEYGRTIIGPVWRRTISANSRFASAFTSALSRRRARSALKNMKLTNWRAGAAASLCLGWVWGSTVVVMRPDFSLIRQAFLNYDAGHAAARGKASAHCGAERALVPAAPHKTAAARRVSTASEDRRQDDAGRSGAGHSAAVGGGPSARSVA